MTADPRIEAAAEAMAFGPPLPPEANGLERWRILARQALAAADAVAPNATRTAALDEALAAWTEAAHGLEPDEVEEGSYHAGWDDGVDIYRNAIRALKEPPR